MLPCIAAVAIATVVGKKTFGSHVHESDTLLMQNVEALSQNGESKGIRIKCYSSLVYELGSFVVDCSTCKLIEDHSDAWYCIHGYCMTTGSNN